MNKKLFLTFLCLLQFCAFASHKKKNKKKLHKQQQTAAVVFENATTMELNTSEPIVADGRVQKRDLSLTDMPQPIVQIIWLDVFRANLRPGASGYIKKKNDEKCTWRDALSWVAQCRSLSKGTYCDLTGIPRMSENIPCISEKNKKEEKSRWMAHLTQCFEKQIENVNSGKIDASHYAFNQKCFQLLGSRIVKDAKQEIFKSTFDAFLQWPSKFKLPAILCLAIKYKGHKQFMMQKVFDAIEKDIVSVSSEQEKINLIMPSNQSSWVVKQLFKLFGDDYVDEETGDNCLYYAVLYKKFELAKYLLERKPENINHLHKTGTGFLQLALENKDATLAYFLISKGVNINLKLPVSGESLLAYALNNGCIGVATEIMKSTNLDQENETALIAAIKNNQDDWAKQLIEKSIGITSIDGDSNTIFHLIAKHHNDPKLIELVLEKQLSKEGNNALQENKINKLCSLNVDGQAPIHVAVEFGNLSVLSELLKQGVPIDFPDNSSNTPIHKAVSRDLNGVGIIEFLVSKGAGLNIPNLNGSTPIQKALYEGKEAAVLSLINAYKKENLLQNNLFEEIVAKALRNGWVSILSHFVRFDKAAFGLIPLQNVSEAFSKPRYYMFELLCEGSFGCEQKTTFGDSILHLLVKSIKQMTVDQIKASVMIAQHLSKFSNINAMKDANDKTALECANVVLTDLLNDRAKLYEQYDVPSKEALALKISQVAELVKDKQSRDYEKNSQRMKTLNDAMEMFNQQAAVEDGIKNIIVLIEAGSK